MNLHEDEHQEIINSIEEALATLISKKNFSEITVSELVKKAGIARSTFYRNYDNKEDIIRFSIQRTLREFDEQFSPKTVDERYEAKYILEVWEYIIKYNNQIRLINKAGLANIYLDEFNHHLLNIYSTKGLNLQDKIRLFGLAGAQYNIIFNLALQSDNRIDMKKFEFELEHHSNNYTLNL